MGTLNIAYLFPRLDVPFKDFGGPIPKVRGEISPIRKHWENFMYSLQTNMKNRGYNFDIYEKPLWQFDPIFAENRNVDLVFVPHRERQVFHVSNAKTLFYMQTVFPQYFSIDHKGWGGNLSYLPISTENNDDIWFEEFRTNYIKNNISKFDQPRQNSFNESDYYAFLCQLPHDETIKYHSKVEVIDGLKTVLDWGKKNKKKIVVKGHPVNPASMYPLEQLTNQYKNAIWVDNVSIHDVIANSIGCFSINSGSSMEVLLHKKPLVLFGKSECLGAVPLAEPDIKDLSLKLNDAEKCIDHYSGFVKNYLDTLYDSKNSKSFDKLKIDIVKV